MAGHRLSTRRITTRTINKTANTKDMLLQEKITLVTDSLAPFFKNMLTTRLSGQNATTVCDYIIANKRENNVGRHMIGTKIQTLVNFSEFIGVGKQFRKGIGAGSAYTITKKMSKCSSITTGRTRVLIHYTSG